MLRRKKDKAKAVDVVKKVYCGQCQFFDQEYCDTHPEISDHEYFAPGHTISTRAMGALRNMKNDCKYFKKKKATPILQKSP